MKKDIVFETRKGIVDISVVREFEKKIGFKFPQSYIDIITKYNEARIENHMDIFYFYSNSVERYINYPFACFLGYNTSCSIEWFWRETLEYDEDAPFPKNIIAFAKDGCGKAICFDYRHDPITDNPKIVAWHAEEERGSWSELSFIASSFDEFLDILYDNRSEEWKIYHEEVFWDNREIARKKALENQ